MTSCCRGRREAVAGRHDGPLLAPVMPRGSSQFLSSRPELRRPYSAAMDATEQAEPMTQASDRVMRAAPLDRPDELVRTVAALSGATPLVEGMQGYIGRNDNWRVPTAEGGDLFVKRLSGAPEQVATRMNRLLAFQEIIAAHPPREARPVHLCAIICPAASRSASRGGCRRRS